MGPMITYHDTVALKFPLKSPHHEETANKMNISKPKIPKAQVLPTQDYEKTQPLQPEIISSQIEVSPLGSPHQLLSPLTKNRAQHGNNRRRAPSPRRLRAAGAASASPKLSDDSSGGFLQRQKRIVIYYIKNFVKESQ